MQKGGDFIYLWKKIIFIYITNKSTNYEKNIITEMKGMVSQMERTNQKYNNLNFKDCYNILNFIYIIYPIIQEDKNNFNIDRVISKINESDFVTDYDKEYFVEFLLKMKGKKHFEMLQELDETIINYVGYYIEDEYDRERDDSQEQ